MQFKALEKMGLTRQQEEIYLELLKKGSSTVGNLIKSTKVGRVSCYDTLNRLINKGLVSFVKTRGQRLYQAINPQALLKIAEDKEKEAQQEKIEIKKIVFELENLKNSSQGSEQEATIYKTVEGMKSLFELMLREQKTIHVMSATGRAMKEMKSYFPRWHAQRVKHKIETHILFNEELKNKSITTIPLAKIKYLKKEQSSPATVFIFGRYVATLYWEQVPFAIVIQSSPIAKSYKNYFDIIWPGL